MFQQGTSQRFGMHGVGQDLTTPGQQLVVGLAQIRLPQGALRVEMIAVRRVHMSYPNISELHDHFLLFSLITVLMSTNSGHFWHLFWALIP